MLKKCTGVMLSVILSVSSIMGIQANASNWGAAPTAMTPTAIGTSTTFPAGESDRATMKYWINDFKGGIDLYTLNYCDFYAKGYVEDSWGFEYPFSGTRYETTSCGFSSGDYTAMQQIIKCICKCRSMWYWWWWTFWRDSKIILNGSKKQIF